MQDSADLEAQLASKEREWKELQALRIQQLETALSEATSELSNQRERFLRLRDDFQYNLRVLEERDRELERYDAMAVHVHTEESVRQAELSELRIQLAKLQDALGEVNKQKEDLQAQYQKRGVEHRLQLERVYSVKEDEIQTLREENETLRRDLQRRIQASDGELALQKQEMLADFDSEMRKREHEFNMKLDEMRNVVLSHELKVQLLNKEVDLRAKGHDEAVEALQLSEQLCQQAQKEILNRDWDLKTTSAVKDSRINELEEKVTQMKAKHKKEEEVSNRKHAELERAAREKETALETMKEVHVSEMHEEKKKAIQLQMQLDSLILEQEKREKRHADKMSQKEQQIQELRAQLEKTQASWDAYVTQVSKETVGKDTELLSAGDREAKIRAELQKCKEDSERHKQQLASAIQREQALEQKCVQLELDWERRCEEVRAEHYLKSEELIHGLTQSRDKVNAELKEKERELQEIVALLKSVTIERDEALHGFTSKTSSQVVGPQEIGPTSLFWAEPGRAPWVKTRPPGARMRAPTLGLAPGRGPNLQHSGSRSKRSLCETENSKDETDPQPHNRFYALEQLQYKLTTQELQFAQRDLNNRNPIIVYPLSGSGSGASDTNPWEQPTRVIVQRSVRKENIPPVHSHSKSPVQHQAGSSQTLPSSMCTDESLQDVWKMLDHGLSPTVLTSSNSEDQARAEENRNTPHPGLPVRVQGLKAVIQERNKQARTTSEPGKKAKPAGKAVKIRNYNIKD
ncbi:coiled-coil domain-containing protein 57 isoform X1 [Tachysurus ichikawai]